MFRRWEKVRIKERDIWLQKLYARSRDCGWILASSLMVHWSFGHGWLERQYEMFWCIKSQVDTCFWKQTYSTSPWLWLLFECIKSPKFVFNSIGNLSHLQKTAMRITITNPRDCSHHVGNTGVLGLYCSWNCCHDSARISVAKPNALAYCNSRKWINRDFPSSLSHLSECLPFSLSQCFPTPPDMCGRFF